MLHHLRPTGYRIHALAISEQLTMLSSSVSALLSTPPASGCSWGCVCGARSPRGRCPFWASVGTLPVGRVQLETSQNRCLERSYCEREAEVLHRMACWRRKYGTSARLYFTMEKTRSTSIDDRHGRHTKAQSKHSCIDIQKPLVILYKQETFDIE